MRQQDIQKIIEQVENCSAALKELSRLTSEAQENAAEDNDATEILVASVQKTMVATLRIGTDAQLEALKELIKDINNK